MRRQNIQGVLGRISHAFHVRPHTAADIEQKENVDGHALAVEHFDGGNFAIDAKNKIARLQAGYGAAVLVENLGIYTRKGNVALEYDWIVSRKNTCGER
jgi:hypothetical protein